MIEKFAEYFYDPLVFWMTPLVIVVLIAVWRRLHAWRQRWFSGGPPGDGNNSGGS